MGKVCIQQSSLHQWGNNRTDINQGVATYLGEEKSWIQARPGERWVLPGVFANGPGDLVSIPGRVISKAQKWYLKPPCLTLSIIMKGSRVKWINPRKGVGPSPTPWCSSYRKGSLRVTLDYGRQLIYFIPSVPRPNQVTG